MEKKISIQPVLYSRKDKNNLYPVKIRITENRKSKFESLNFSIQKSHWLKSNRVSVSHPNHIEYNFIIEKKLKEYENIQNKFGKVQVGKLNLLVDLEKRIQSFPDKQYYSKKRYKTLYYHLINFWGNLDLHYYNIDKDFFIGFKKHLSDNIVSRNTLTNTPSSNTLVNYLNTLKTFLLEQQKEGIFLKDLSFTKGIIPTKSPTPKRTLSKEEMWKLNNLLPSYPFFRPLLWDSLNTFLFSFWGNGLRIGDTLRLKFGNIVDDVIILKMEKTDRELIIPLNYMNIHRIKFYLDSYHPLWNWNEKKWNNYNDSEFDTNQYNEVVFYDENSYLDVLLEIEKVKDELYEYELMGDGELLFEEMDRWGVKYHNIIKQKEEKKYLFEMLDNKLDTLNKNLLYSIKEYSKKNKNQYIFPFLRGFEDEKNLTKLNNKISSSISLINRSLKEIGKNVNIDKNFSNHWSRHTITSISRSMGVDIYDLKTWLGHSSVKQTEIYINTLTTYSSLKNSENVKSFLDD